MRHSLRELRAAGWVEVGTVMGMEEVLFNRGDARLIYGSVDTRLLARAMYDLREARGPRAFASPQVTETFELMYGWSVSAENQLFTQNACVIERRHIQSACSRAAYVRSVPDALRSMFDLVGHAGVASFLDGPLG